MHESIPSKPLSRSLDRERLGKMFDLAPGFMAILEGSQHQIVLANKSARRLLGNGVIGRATEEVLPPGSGSEIIAALDEAYLSGKPLHLPAAVFPATQGSGEEQRILDLVLQPITETDGTVSGIFIEGSDVTERVRAEQRLKGSFEIRTVGIIYWDREYRLADVNEAFLEMTGFELPDAIGLSWQQLTPPEFWPAAERALEQVAASGEATPYEKQYLRKDGSRWWGLFAPRRVSQDEIVEFVLDITARKEFEQALRNREQRLGLIVDTATDYAILTLDPQRCVTSWSPGAARIFGYEAEEIIGQLVDVLFTPEDREAGIPAQEAEHARRRGSAPDVRWHVRKHGSPVFIQGSSHVLRGESGEELGFLKIGRDESDRRRADDRIRETEERYRLAAEATNDAIWDWDLTTDCIGWSEAFYTMFGYAANEVEPSGRWWTSKIHPEDRERIETGVQQAIAAELSWAAEYRFERRDGSYADVLDRGTVIRDKFGLARRMVGAMHDLTPHRTAEAELRRLNETLEHRVLEEVTTRMKTEDALRQSQKLEAIGQLTGGVAHDFNNLLTVIVGAAEMLRRPELAEEKRKRYVAAIADTANRAAKLTGQLLAFSRRQALKPEVFDVGRRIEAIKDMLTTVAGARVSLVTDTDCDICYVEADPSQFETALVNMAVNARDAMDGAGQLEIGLKPAKTIPSVRGHVAADGEFVAVYISDTGSGIPTAQLGQIFEPFFTTKEVGKGTGLGLSQVYGFAKQSGGEVSVESVVGSGTTFTIYLPRVAPDRMDVTRTDTPTAARGSGHILVVEDNEQVGSFSTQILSEVGFETTWVASADAALQLLSENPERYAAVFSDVVMPGVSGIELGREIRRRIPGLPVILTSGYSHVLAQEGSHGFEVLHKPYSIEHLTRVLRRVVLDPLPRHD